MTCKRKPILEMTRQCMCNNFAEHASEEEMTDFLREIAMLKHVGYHKHVIRMIGCCTRKAPLAALLEHAPRGDLLTLLRSARGKTKVEQNTSSTMRIDSSGKPTRPSEADSKSSFIIIYNNIIYNRRLNRGH